MKTIKKITLVIVILTTLYALYAFKITNKTPPPILPTADEQYQEELNDIMNEETFKKSVYLQAERIHAEREKKAIETKLEEIRKAELNLASTSKQSFLE